MRVAAIALLLCACSSKKAEEAKPVDKPVAAPVVKKPVPTTPLPPLAKDPGGATGKPIWATGFGGLGMEVPRAIAVDADGNTYVAGYFDGETDLGALGKRKSNGASDAFVVKLDNAGKLVWAKTFGGPREDNATGIAVNGDTVVVVGNFCDKFELDGQTQTAIGSDDLFVVAFDRGGTTKWTWRLGGIDSDGANAVAAAPDGGWVIGGSFKDSIAFGATHLKSKGGTDALLAKLAPGGDLEWMKQFGGRYNDSIRYVALDANSNIYVQGVFRDTADWGGPPLVAAGGAADDVVLAKYDVNGDHVWSKRFGSGLEDGGVGGVTVDPAGHVTMVGSFDKTVSFGEGDAHTANGESDAFVAQFGSDGKLEWARTYGGERVDAAIGVAADAAGNIYTTGFFWNSVDFGKGALTSKGNKDVFALKLDPKGNTVWAESWGDHDHDQGRAVAVDGKGQATFAGIYHFTLDLTGKPLESARAEGDRIPKPDVYVVRLER